MKQNLLLNISTVNDEDATEPVTVAEAKNWLRITVPDDDVLLAELITTARQQCENYLNISLIERVVTARIQNDFGDYDLPFGPLVPGDEDESFTSITDDEYEPVTIETSNYTLRGNKLTTPDNCIINVSYLAGYPDGIPIVFKTAILNQVAHIFENRGDDVTQQLSNETMLKLKPFRRVV